MAAAPALRALLRQLHPCTVPARYQLERCAVEAAFGHWVQEQVQEQEQEQERVQQPVQEQAPEPVQPPVQPREPGQPP